MAKVNLDTTDRLDITCRRGDTFELTLTLKDSSGSGLNLATDDYQFLMQVRGGKPTASTAQRVPTSTEYGSDRLLPPLIIGSSQLGEKAPCNFTFNSIDDNGNVTVFLSAENMRKIPAGRYKYDLQYVKDTTHKTVLEGRFVINEDISKINL